MPAKVAPKKKSAAKKSAPKLDEALLDRAHEILRANVDLHAGGDVNAPNIRARQALDLFEKHRYNAAFHDIASAILEAA